MSAPASPSPPSSAQLLRATVAAALVAGLLLVTIVLPAEFGRDPFGVGRALGFVPAGGRGAQHLGGLDVDTAVSTSSALLTSPAPYRTDEMTLTLQPGEGAEIKAVMTQGQRVVFSWTTTGGGVDVDMHGEATGGAEGHATGYWKEKDKRVGTARSTRLLPAITDGSGRTLNDDPVTVTAKVSGFHQKWFRP